MRLPAQQRQVLTCRVQESRKEDQQLNERTYRNKPIEAERKFHYSVVIPAYNAAATLRSVLEGLKSQTIERDRFECIVVDDGSTDRTAEIIDEYTNCLNLQIIRHSVNFGRGTSRDDGWKAAGGQYVVFLDADMIPGDTWLAGFDVKRNEMDFDVLSGSIKNSSDTCPTGQPPLRIFEVLETKLKTQSSSWVYAAFASNLAIRRSLLERVSGFNTFFPGFEDVELNLRLWEAGATYGHAEAASAQHIGSTPSGALGDVWMTANDLSRLFIRHPYRELLLIAAWGRFECNSPSVSQESCLTSLEAFKALSRAEDNSLVSSLNEAYGSAPTIDCRYEAGSVIAACLLRRHCTEENGYTELQRGVDDGLYTEVRDGVRLFDMAHSTTWFGSCARGRSSESLVWGYTRKCTPYQASLHPKDAIAFHCTGSYEVTVPVGELNRFQGGVKINIPVPVEHACQRNVRLSNCHPAGLLDSLKHGQGMILRQTMTAADQPTVRMSYDFEYDVYEYVPVAPIQADPVNDIQSQYLRPGLPDEFMNKARSILTRAMPDTSTDTYNKVRSLYKWTWDNFEFIEFPLPPYDLMDTGYGGCASRIRLFISLLRLAGVPIREQAGVLYGDGVYTGPSMTYFQQTTGTSPFVHTWAEFYTPECGWIPVSEFAAPARVTGIAVLSDDVRQIVMRACRRRCRAVFGSLDPYRMYGAESANKLPTYPIVKTAQGWQADPDVTAATLHTVRCNMEQI